MRLVDLLLLPRQQSYGVSSNDSLYRHPLGSAYLRSKNSEELKSNMKNLEFYRRQESAVGQQPTDKSFRSTGSLSDLLRSKKSPTSPGHWNHATANPPPSSAAVETALRLAQDSKPRVGLINGFVKQESDLENCGFTTAARGCFDDDRRPFPTMDKTLNGNIWNREELSSPSSSSSSVSKFFPSLSSSSSSSSPSSASSLGLDDRAFFHRRRISLLSSDGSELEPEQILSLATDSDGYESLSSSPLEAVDSAGAGAGAAGAFRWTEHGPDASFGYLDWHGGGGGGGEGEGEGETERGGYDIDACPLFNFNFLENTLDDCPFESFDTKDTIPRFDESGFCDSPMVSMVPDVIMATETMKNCSSFSDRDDVQSSSFRGHPFKLNELDRRTRHGMKSNDGSDLSDFPPSSSVTALPGMPAASVSNMETLQQSEVVKLLLQNRHQWAVPQEKVPSPPVGCRGSRKRASAATNGRDVGRAKVPRETRPYNDVPSNEETSLPYAPFARANSFSASMVMVDGQDRYDQSSSLEKLITELMLFESTKSDSEGDDVARNSPSEATSAAALPPYAELFAPSLSLHPSELFDGLAACRISDTELFSSLDLESVYLSDCEPFAALGDGLDFENAKSFEAFVKTEPDKAPFLSLPPSPTSSSLCQPDSFGHRPAGRNWLGGEDAPSSSRNDGCATIVDGHKSSVLERILQSNLLFDSLDCDSKLVASGGRGWFVSDHDYCQNLEVLSLDGGGALDLTYDLRHEKRRRTEISPSSCYVRKRDYSALKSLLLDSNLTEEVRKEVELDRAKSRKKMSEKLKVTSVNDPARLQRLGRIRDDRILKQHLENENYDPCCEVDPSNSETTMESISCPPQEEKCAAFGDQSLAAAGRCSPAVGLLPRRDLGSGTARPELPAETSDDNNTLVTSDLELSGGDDAVFFNSFEDFYSKNQCEIESNHHHHQSNASNDDENDDPTTQNDDSSLTEFEPKVRRNKRKSAISKRVRVYRSVGRGGLKVPRSPPRMRRSPTGTGRPLIRTGKDRSVNHRRRNMSNSTRHLRPKSPPISNNRSAL